MSTEVEERFSRVLQSSDLPISADRQYWLKAAFKHGIRTSGPWDAKYGTSGELELVAPGSNNNEWDWGLILRKMNEESAIGFVAQGDSLDQMGDALRSAVKVSGYLQAVCFIECLIFD